VGYWAERKLMNIKQIQYRKIEEINGGKYTGRKIKAKEDEDVNGS
jgi:hypothetical protein